MSRTVAAGARGNLWFIPVTCVLAGVMVSIGTMWVDRAADFELVPRWMHGGPDAALGILTTIAISMVSLATLVLTITMVVVQLAMGQFSPRIVQTFLRDRPSQLAIGLFVATFAHSMLAMRDVSFDDGGQVPGVAIAVAYVLVLRAVQAIDRLHDGLRQLARRRLPDGTHCDERGVCRLAIPAMGWDDYVHLAFDEIRMAGAASPQVSRRLLAAIDDLLVVAPQGRRPPLEDQRELLIQAVTELGRDRRDRVMAMSPDEQGLGVTVDSAASDGVTRTRVEHYRLLAPSLTSAAAGTPALTSSAVGPTVSAASASRSPRGRWRPDVVSFAVCRSDSALSSAPRTMA